MLHFQYFVEKSRWSLNVLHKQFQMWEHKLQSSEGVPNLKLALVPKMLTPLVRHWVPEAFVVSFKLETNQDLLIVKAR